MYVNLFSHHGNALQKDSHYSQSVDEETEVQREKDQQLKDQQLASGRIRIQTQVCVTLSPLSPLFRGDPNTKLYIPRFTQPKSKNIETWGHDAGKLEVVLYLLNIGPTANMCACAGIRTCSLCLSVSLPALPS